MKKIRVRKKKQLAKKRKFFVFVFSIDLLWSLLVWKKKKNAYQTVFISVLLCTFFIYKWKVWTENFFVNWDNVLVNKLFFFFFLENQRNMKNTFLLLFFLTFLFFLSLFFFFSSWLIEVRRANRDNFTQWKLVSG